MAPTEAGERLFRTVEPRLAEIEAELAVLGNMRGMPVGTVRITASEHAVRSVVWPRLLPWLANYPEIKVEISSENRFVDIVAERFDIGIRLGGDVAKNMIALRVAPDMRMVVVGSPAYFERNAPPRTLQELSEHDCIGLRLPTHGGLLPWEFKHGERVTTVHVEGRLVFNRSDLMADAAVAGNGLAWLPHDMVHEYLAAGRLVTTLDAWEISFPGYHLYYATRRSSAALALVVDALRLPESRMPALEIGADR